MNRWLVLDVSYLCWRLFHTSLRDLSHGDVGTGVLYGFVRDMLSFQEHHGTSNVAFCFDSRESKRKEILPTYKSRREELRKEESREDQAARESMYRQIALLRKEFLPSIGFRNVFFAKGYEADDLIASVVLNRSGREIVIVSADEDLLQLLRPGVSIWKPGPFGKDKTITDETFQQEWGIRPRQWRMVKAIAGCKSDDVPGCPGIGEKTAVKFIRKELPKKPSKSGKPTQYEKIRDFQESAQKNMELVSLPFKGVPDLTLHRDELDGVAWKKMLKRFGINSIRFTPPVIGVRRGKGT